MNTSETLKRIFWSTGRKVWVGVTIGDAARRLRTTPAKAHLALVDMEEIGYASSVGHRTSYRSLRELDIPIWDITEQGKGICNDT